MEISTHFIFQPIKLYFIFPLFHYSLEPPNKTISFSISQYYFLFLKITYFDTAQHSLFENNYKYIEFIIVPFHIEQPSNKRTLYIFHDPTKWKIAATTIQT